ncbi:MAG: MerR family DNA-binding transcriptional regulator [Arenicella sp.]|nr:MerR family DNA-binding transcriptional regulator [Arenicella sp.]
MKQDYSIRELAEEFDVTTRTLRFYEEKGLLNPSRSGQTRVYNIADRTRLKLILRGKRLGLSLDESAEIILMYDPIGTNSNQILSLIDKIQDKRLQLEQKKKDLELTLLDLEAAEQRCSESLSKIH